MSVTLVKVEGFEFDEAYNNFNAFCIKHMPEVDKGKMFTLFLGTKLFYNVTADSITLAPEAVHKIKLLTSPHQHTILMAFKARMESK